MRTAVILLAAWSAGHPLWAGIVPSQSPDGSPPCGPGKAREEVSVRDRTRTKRGLEISGGPQVVAVKPLASRASTRAEGKGLRG